MPLLRTKPWYGAAAEAAIRSVSCSVVTAAACTGQAAITAGRLTSMATPAATTLHRHQRPRRIGTVTSRNLGRPRHGRLGKCLQIDYRPWSTSSSIVAAIGPAGRLSADLQEWAADSSVTRTR